MDNPTEIPATDSLTGEMPVTDGLTGGGAMGSPMGETLTTDNPKGEIPVTGDSMRGGPKARTRKRAVSRRC